MKNIIFLLLIILLITSFINYNENFVGRYKINFKSDNKYKIVNGFPKQNINLDKNGKFCIQVLNNTSNNNEGSIIVWLDDLPMCDRWIQENDDGNLINGEIKRDITENDGIIQKECGFYTGNYSNGRKGNNWEKYISDMEKRYNNSGKELDKDKIPRFMIINSDGSVDWDSRLRKSYDDNDKKVINRFFKINSGQILRIIPPHKFQNRYNFEKQETKDGDKIIESNLGYLPYMCFLQFEGADSHFNNRGISYGEFSNKLTRDGLGSIKNCGGSGLYVTDNFDLEKSGYNITTESISRVELNFNNGEIFFNFSGVDGSNMSYSAKYDMSNQYGKSIDDLDDFCKRTNINCNSIKIDDVNRLNNNVYTKLNYDLFFRNKNPYVKSIPSIKGFYKKNNKIYFNKPFNIENQCLSPIKFTDFNIDDDENDPKFNVDNWTNWEKAIYYLRIYNKETDISSDSNLYSFNITQNSDGSSKKNKQILNDIKNMKFDISKIPDAILGPERIEINDENCADAPYGYGYNKAICHIWWGLNENNCAKDYTTLIRNTQSDGSMGCTQYTWAYGEMGYDIIHKNLDNLIKNKELIFMDYDGNPQKGPYCDDEEKEKRQNEPNIKEGSCKDKQKYNKPEENDLESPNKPLLNCQLPNNDQVKYKNLKLYPVNINISINYVNRGKYILSDDYKIKCNSNGIDCINGKQEQDDHTFLDLNCYSVNENVCTGENINNCFENLLNIEAPKIWCGNI